MPTIKSALAANVAAAMPTNTPNANIACKVPYAHQSDNYDERRKIPYQVVHAGAYRLLEKQVAPVHAYRPVYPVLFAVSHAARLFYEEIN